MRVSAGLLILPLLYIGFIYSGASIQWAHTNYDNWRLLEVTLIAFSILLFAFYNFKSNRYFLVPTYALVAILIMILIGLGSIYNAKHPLLALLDFSLIVSLCSYSYVISETLSKLQVKTVDTLFAILAVLPLAVIVWFLFSIFLELFFRDTTFREVWHGAFENVRYYADGTLPLLFILWYRPGFLSKFPSMVTIVSSLYLLTFLVDGSRAVLLAIFMSLSLFAITNKGLYKTLMIPFVSIFLSILLLFLMRILSIYSTTESSSVLRTTSSYRLEMWQLCFKQWLYTPFFGIGGGNFNFYDNLKFQDIGHPHNLFLQLVLEWGIAGLIFIAILFLIYFQKFLKNHVFIPPLLNAGMFAIIFNLCLSGAGVYSHSQIIIILFFSYVCFQINKQKKLNHTYNQISKGRQAISEKIVNLFGVLSVLTILALIYPTFFQYARVDFETESTWGPRFWSDAKSLNLPINNERK